MAREATVLIVPGLRDHVPEHWQTLLASRLPRVRTVTPMGRDNLDCLARVEAIEEAAAEIDGPIILVAHSGGVISVVHWARLTRRAVRGALLATPADFDQPLPDGYPTMEALEGGGWLPVPRDALPFRTIVAASRNDPLGSYERVAAFARSWGSKLVDLGEVGHLNPASGFGEWPRAVSFIDELDAAASDCWLKQRAFSLPPCGGGLGRGVDRGTKASRLTTTPTPNPSPQGGGERQIIDAISDRLSA